jgi:hypothetical protein
VLSLYDATSGQVTGIRPAHPGELRVLAITAPVTGEPDAGQLRAWLLPDLIRRCAERRRLVPTICEITAAAAPEPATGTAAPEPGTVAASTTAAATEAEAAAEHAAARAALNIHPPARIAPASEPVERTAGFVAPGWPGRPGRPGTAPPFDIGTGAPDWFTGRTAWPGGPALAGHLAAPVGAAGADGGTPRDLPGLAGRGLDPLALRLVLLGTPYRDGLTLNGGALEAAGKTLQHWRESVAGWALSPSAVMSARYADAVTTAFENDLDTPAALHELDALAADREVPPGAKFETFAALDRLFGLDLARDIGTVSAPRSR